MTTQEFRELLSDLPPWFQLGYDRENECHTHEIDGDSLDSADLEDYLGTLKGIAYGGCASGCHMPAVTYHIARETMSEHGDSVLDYLEEYGDLPDIPQGSSWSGISVHYLSCAVELWVSVHGFGDIDDLEDDDD